MSHILRVLDENIRVLPVLVVAAVFLMFLKSADLWTSVQDEMLGISSARAEQSSRGSGDGSDSGENGEGLGEATNDHSEEAAWVSEGADTYYDEGGIGLSLAEVQVLESLSERREVLDARENEMVMRERLIEAAERRVEERINELRTLEARIQDLLLFRDEAEEAQLASLVSVYENMRPKDAARIFDTLDETILVDVVSRMREQRIALVLAEMQPRAAQELTVMLATRLVAPGTE